VPAANGAFRFELEGRSGDARAGRFTTPHGALHTPAFMPVGTHGAVKAMTPEQVRATGAEMILANAVLGGLSTLREEAASDER